MPDSNLSPAAQAVVNAAVVNAAVEAGGKYERATPVLHARLAAALCAAVDQAVPESCFESDDITAIRNALLAIADELGGITYGTYRCNLKAQ